MGLITVVVMTMGAASPARAGWFKDWCARTLVMEDPYQYEDRTDEWLMTRIDYLETRALHRQLLPDLQVEYDLLKRERDSRERVRKILRDRLDRDATGDGDSAK